MYMCVCVYIYILKCILTKMRIQQHNNCSHHSIYSYPAFPILVCTL